MVAVLAETVVRAARAAMLTVDGTPPGKLAVSLAVAIMLMGRGTLRWTGRAGVG